MDVLCQAKSGMGKTAVFVLSVLQQLEPVDGEVGAIIVCHTRELAYQVSRGEERRREQMECGGCARARPSGGRGQNTHPPSLSPSLSPPHFQDLPRV